MMDNQEKISPNTSRPSEQEGELIGMLTKQLYMAGDKMDRMQAVLKKVESQAKSKDREITRLKKKLKDWEMKNKNIDSTTKVESNSSHENSDHVYKKCVKLEQKLHEMEKFLADYGLTWVGEKKKNPTKNINSDDFINSCFTSIAANIRQLNLSVGNGEMHICHSKGGASFKTPPCVTITFYKNGMIWQKGQLRDYKHPKSRSFIQDILDGYFPSQLQNDYPNGVPLKVEDRRAEMYLGGNYYPGRGYQLGKLSSNYRLTPALPGKSSRNLIADKKPKFDLPNLEQTSPRVISPDRRNLRTQILASHNNNCSDTHLKSHMNAEIVLSSRSEKGRSKLGIAIAAAGSHHRQCQAIDQASLNVASSSLSQSRFHSKPFPVVSSAHSSYAKETLKCRANKVGKLLPSRSAILGKHTAEVPILQKINESSGAASEFRLKIRSMTGSAVYLVHVSADDKVERLYQLLDKVLLSKRVRCAVDYRIVISGYSPKRLDRLDMLLRDYGINRDSVLHLVDD